MIDLLKSFFVSFLWRCFVRTEKKENISGWKRKIYLYKLHRDDRAQWRVEKAREKGVKIGSNCRLYSMNFFTEPNLVTIGNNVIVSGEVKFVTHDGAIYLLKDEISNLRGNYGQIIIGDNCFIGISAIICQNVSIGRNSIIAAGAVVIDSFPENSVIMGNPAKVVFKFDMYRKMKRNSPYTLTHLEYPFPSRIPTHERARLVEDNILSLPVKQPKKNNK